MNDPHAAAKRLAAVAAANLVEPGTTIGLGTGSTFALCLERLGERMRDEGLQFRGVPTSEATARRARELGIPLVDLAEIDFLHLAIDGADEIDPEKNMIKGGGGALVRERIVAANAREMIVLVGENKLVGKLGSTFRLPVEVMRFGHRQVARELERLGGKPALRARPDGSPFVSDNEHLIYDCDFGPIEDPRRLAVTLRMLPGVVDSGLFVGMAGRVFVGTADGTVRTLP